MTTVVDGPHPHRKWIVLASLVMAAIIGVAYVVVLDSFNADSARRESQPYIFPKHPNDNVPYGIYIGAHVVSVDPKVPNAVVVHMDFGAVGTLVDEGQLLQKSVRIYVPESTGAGDSKGAGGAVRTFEMGSPMSALNLTMYLQGSVGAYPFDSYRGDFYLEAFTVDATKGTLEQRIPTRLRFFSGLHGYRIQVTTDAVLCKGFDAATLGCNSAVLRVQRARSTVFFAISTMVLMWALALAGVAMALVLILKRREIGPGPLGYLAALLFAFPAIRNAMPGSPDVGAKFDVLSFFWAEGIVAITLVVLAVHWIVREARSDGTSAEVMAIHELVQNLQSSGAVHPVPIDEDAEVPMPAPRPGEPS